MHTLLSVSEPSLELIRKKKIIAEFQLKDSVAANIVRAAFSTSTSRVRDFYSFSNY